MDLSALPTSYLKIHRKTLLRAIRTRNHDIPRWTLTDLEIERLKVYLEDCEAELRRRGAMR